MDIVSACLCGVNCKYSGGNNFNPKIYKEMLSGKLLPVCPELLGGLGIPRSPCEISEGKVINKEGNDVTQNFIEGAEKTLEIAKIVGAERAILKQRSPSCGNGKIYDGSFCGRLIEGYGITAKILKDNGIEVISEEEF
ncbi:MAG: DUF523 domain-containing protein [Bacillota bacterium]|nr:DUF523 domain-containing protein [Bacillota bacterium]